MRSLRFSFVILCVFLLAGTPAVLAQAAPVVTPAPAPTPNIEQQQLQTRLQELEAQIAQAQEELRGIRSEKSTAASRLTIAKKEQDTLNLQVYLTNLQIADIADELKKAQSDFQITQMRAEQYKRQIADVVLRLYEQERHPPVLTLVRSGSISEAVTELHNVSTIGDSLKELLADAKKFSAELAERQQALSAKQEEVERLLAVQRLQQEAAAEAVVEQGVLLAQVKGKEGSAQAVLTDTQKQASAIRGRLYQLLGVTTQVQFGEAVQIAQWASDLTGVRAAFLLAILTQESSLGKNVGTCNRAGDPESKSWKVVMKPERDQTPFLKITAELGLDPNTTPISCPMRDAKGNQVGWGGAMGPAQFIPSTWMGYKDKVSALTGKPANPWDLRDAFVAAAVKLGNDGAKTVEGEWAAAMRYFSGSTNTRFRFYGDNVVAQAQKYQRDIDAIK